jgi:hypothetical protein
VLIYPIYTATWQLLNYIVMNSLEQSFSLDIDGILGEAGLVPKLQRNTNEKVPERQKVQAKAYRPENMEDEYKNGGALKTVRYDSLSNSSLGKSICSIMSLPSQVCSS